MTHNSYGNSSFLFDELCMNSRQINDQIVSGQERNREGCKKDRNEDSKN